MNTFELSLDLDKSVGAKQWITLRQGDKRGTTLRATLYDHGVLVSGSYTCRVSIRHPNRNTYYRETATYSNGVATVTIDETSAASVVGVTEGYFELLQGSTLIASTESFGVRVLQSATDGATVGPPYDSAIEDALAELDAATGRISQMVVDATAEYLAAHPEITTTVQDNSVTDAKLIQSGGVLDRVGRLWWRLENLLTATPAEAESVTVSDAAKTPVAGLTVFGKSTQDGTPTPDAPVAIESVEPNILRNTASTITVNGITFTVNDDGTVTANGTATANAQLRIDTFVPSDGTYTISGCPANGSSSTYAIRAYTNDGVTYAVQDVGAGATFDFVASTHVNLSVYIFVFRNATVNNLTFGPMVARGTKAIREFVPYNGIGLWARGRNLIDSIPDATRAGVTFTFDRDKGVTVVGTSTGMWASVTTDLPIVGLEGRTVTVSASGITGELYASFRQYTNDKQQVAGSAIVDILGWGSTAPVTFTLADETFYIHVVIGVRNSETTVNAVIKPQIEVGGTAHAYEPYTESVTALPLDGHALRSLPDGTRDEVTVDKYGHVILVQRVGSYTIMGEETALQFAQLGTYSRLRITCLQNAQSATGSNGLYTHGPYFASWSGDSAHGYCAGNYVHVFAVGSTAAEVLAATDGAEIVYPLATPKTFDLGTIDPTALVGPDMTAQAVPTAPFALTYERDLNATLARLEAAIADAATA